MKKIIFIDMDGVLADYIGACKSENIDPKEGKHIKGFFEKLSPVEGAINAFNWLSNYFDVYILTTAPYSNPDAWMEKVKWVKEHLGDIAYKRIIISHHKNLCIGDYLIDDSPRNGAAEFTGQWIQFGTDFPNWKTIINYLKIKENIKD